MWSLCCYVEKNEAGSNQNIVMTLFPDVIDINYNDGFIWLSSEIFLVSESSNNGEILPEGTWKLIRIMEIIEL